MSVNETEVHPLESWALLIIGVAVSLMHIWFNVFAVLSSLWQNALHFAGFALLVAITYPLRRNGPLVWRLFDVMLGVLAASSAIFLIAREDAIYSRGIFLVQSEWIAGIIVILCAIEFTRRVAGWFIPVLIVVGLTYIGWWGSELTGMFRFAGLTPETLLFRSIYGDDALFGSIAQISSSYVFMFLLFGAFLLRSGAGDFVIDMARAAAGRMVGGPGFVAVIASALMGTISGSAVANTASTGVITIPLMKRAGFSPKFAAGSEAAASTGGQLMPPIMGAGAFVMATYTQIPYTTIVLVSILPAILYFASVGFFIRIEAKRNGISVLDEEKVSFVEIMKKGGIVFILPITILIGLLIYGFTPTYAAGYSMIAVVVSSWLTPNKMGFRAIIDSLAMGAKNMVMTAILLCTIGLIVNVITTAGIGNTFSLMINQWAGHSLIIAIGLIALASLVLGMGLPVTAAYIVLGTLSAPALQGLIADGMLVKALVSGQIPEAATTFFMLAVPDKLALIGEPMSVATARSIVDAIPFDMANMVRESVLSSHTLTFALLSAHLIVFWLSQDSNVTPPVALAAFAAAAIAGSKPMITGFYSWKLAKGLYIIPLLFAYTPFIGGSLFQDLYIFFFALFGLYAFAAGIEGYMEEKLNPLLRILTLLSAAIMLWPTAWWINMIGWLLLISIFILNKRKAMAGQTVRTVSA